MPRSVEGVTYSLFSVHGIPLLKPWNIATYKRNRFAKDLTCNMRSILTSVFSGVRNLGGYAGGLRSRHILSPPKSGGLWARIWGVMTPKRPNLGGYGWGVTISAPPNLGGYNPPVTPPQLGLWENTGA